MSTEVKSITVVKAAKQLEDEIEEEKKVADPPKDIAMAAIKKGEKDGESAREHDRGGIS